MFFAIQCIEWHFWKLAHYALSSPHFDRKDVGLNEGKGIAQNNPRVNMINQELGYSWCGCLAGVTNFDSDR